MDATKVIIKPLLSEKSTRLSSTRNTYTFQVPLEANKVQIREAVEALYSVKVTGVRTIVRKGKPKRARQRMTVRSDIKRAIVTLAEDSKIELF